MAILRIRTFGDPVLREKSQAVDVVTDDHRRLIADMIDTMRDAPGVGLAAPQVGVLDRIFVWEVEEETGVVLNPTIVTPSSEMVTEEEGCLSLPGLAYDVTRHAEVTLEGLDEQGQPISISGTDLLSRVFQHELDHLDGVLFIDRIEAASRKEALGILRDQALGLRAPMPPAPADERL